MLEKKSFSFFTDYMEKGDSTIEVLYINFMIEMRLVLWSKEILQLDFNWWKIL